MPQTLPRHRALGRHGALIQLVAAYTVTGTALPRCRVPHASRQALRLVERFHSALPFHSGTTSAGRDTVSGDLDAGPAEPGLHGIGLEHDVQRGDVAAGRGALNYDVTHHALEAGVCVQTYADRPPVSRRGPP